MEDAKHVVEAFIGRNGSHDTTVHEKVSRAITQDTVTKTEHEEITTAIDKEIHQDHFHTSVQPITDEEYQEEKHHHVVSDVEQHTFEHDDSEQLQKRLAEEAANFKDESHNVIAAKTTTTLPNVIAEHLHHHVHETIQPIVSKQTFEPHVYHIVKRIHETHHNAALHHATSTLPAVTMADFKKQGGTLAGRAEHYDAFEGEPRLFGKAVAGNASQQSTAGRANETFLPHSNAAAAPSKTAGAQPGTTTTPPQPAATAPFKTAGAPSGPASVTTQPAAAAPSKTTGAPSGPAPSSVAPATPSPVERVSTVKSAPSIVAHPLEQTTGGPHASNSAPTGATTSLGCDIAAPASTNRDPVRASLAQSVLGDGGAPHPLMRPPLSIPPYIYRSGHPAITQHQHAASGTSGTTPAPQPPQPTAPSAEHKQ